MTIPRATYRIQLNPSFTLSDAAEMVPYLRDLGVSHLYCSPYLGSTPGSEHGYDVIDHGQIDDELGGSPALEALCEALAAHGMGHLVDIVPNHMAVLTHHNKWWWDVLANGPSSRFARFFDIDWDPPEAALRRQIMLPLLGDRYGRVLESGDIKIERSGDEYVVTYFEHRFPLSPGSCTDEEIEAAGDPAVLHEILERQHYRLAYWRAGDVEMNYRRFFDVKTLAALRMEDPAVFEEAHRYVLRLVDEGKLDGLRVDHVDGLRDPLGYLERLRKAAPRSYIVVEKILEPGEELPADWPVEGTTGYEFASMVLGLYLDKAALPVLQDLYSGFTGDHEDYRQQVYDKKVEIGRTGLAADLERLTELLVRSCEASIHHRDFTRRELREALLAAGAAFPVYRTYVRTGSLSPQDTLRIDIAVQEAKVRRPDLEPGVLDRLAAVLRLETGDAEGAELAARFQQFTGPLMAKGVEDTLFYTYTRFIACNEVGASPEIFGIVPSDLHQAGSVTAASRPSSMLNLSTHDSKRSADVRARLALLSEMAPAWSDAVWSWSKSTEHLCTEAGPDPSIRLLFFQTLVGAWPLEEERAVAYMQKAAREAKTHTSWTDPNESYEEALEGFVRGFLNGPMASEIESFVAPLVAPGRINSLSQTAIALTWPGVPDIYQGDELWQLALVDPDNRRPLDTSLRRSLLGEAPGDLSDPTEPGTAKLHLITRALEVRAREAYAFAGGYEPVEVEGGKDAPAVAFLRGGRVCTIAPRLVLSGDRNAAVSLPRGPWTDALTGRTFKGGPVSCLDLLSDFPVSLLVSD